MANSHLQNSTQNEKSNQSTFSFPHEGKEIHTHSNETTTANPMHPPPNTSSETTSPNTDEREEGDSDSDTVVAGKIGRVEDDGNEDRVSEREGGNQGYGDGGASGGTEKRGVESQSVLETRLSGDIVTVAPNDESEKLVLGNRGSKYG